MYGLVVTSAPAAEPVSFAEAIAHLRTDGTEDAALIETLIKAARRYAERRTGRAFVTQTLRLTLDRFPGWHDNYTIRLPNPPLQSVTSITYLDNGSPVTVSAADYRVDAASEPGRITLADTVSDWPAPDLVASSVTVTYVAGYGAASAVPETLKQAILLLVGHWYEHRMAATTGVIAQEMEMAVDALLGIEWAGSLAGDFG